ncbi:hypothetical protein ACOSP7_023063 [Xanthoceras sorbifolium]
MSRSNPPPCAACKVLRRRCTDQCIFAPHFPYDRPQKFAKVHKVYGSNNVTKILKELKPNLRDDAVNSLEYEAEVRLRDPVHGCGGIISLLQKRLKQLQDDVYSAKKELSTYIGPQAMMPILTARAFIPQQHMSDPSSSRVIQPQHGMFRIMGMGNGSFHNRPFVIREQPQQHQHHPQQFFEAQQRASAAVGEQQEMLRKYKQQKLLHQQHQQQQQISGNAMLPSMALEFFDNRYRIQAQQPPGHHHHHPHSLQAQFLLQSQQAPPQTQQQKPCSDEGSSTVGPSS